MKRRVGFALGAASVLGLFAACANILGVEELTNGAKAVVDAAPGETAPPYFCGSDPAPGVPDASEGASKGTLLFALDSIDFTTNTATPALNLDHACTVDRDSSTCVAPGVGQLNGFALDLPNGADNAMRQLLLQPLPVVNESVADMITTEVQAERWTLLVRITEYDQDMDDPSVGVSIMSGAQRLSDKSWSIDGLGVDGGSGGAPQAARAWVTGGRLVAMFDTLSFVTRSPAGAFEILLHDAWFVADITPTALTNGVVAGRWHDTDALLQLKRFNLPVSCAGKVVSNGFCAVRDIQTNAVDDGKPIECDAVSFGFRFTAGLSSFADPPVDAGALSDPACADLPDRCL